MTDNLPEWTDTKTDETDAKKGSISEQSSQISGPWVTPIIRREDEEPVGLSIFLTGEDLQKIGIEFDDQSSVQYEILKGGYLHITADGENGP